ncbi:MAG: HTH domain-containing protein [bacterium]
MDKDYFIKITLGVYRVTELFPEEEPLKLKIREKANNVLADLILAAERRCGFADKKDIFEKILRDLEIMSGYFLVAEAQKWVDSRNFTVLRKEYEKIREEVENREEKKNSNQSLVKLGSAEITIPVSFPQKPQKQSFLSVRQEKILEFLKHRKNVAAGELKKDFPEVSKRTLQRDLEILVSENLLTRKGENNATFYQFKV